MKKLLVVADKVGMEQFAFQKAQELARLSAAKLHVVLGCYESLAMFDRDETNRDAKEIKSRILSGREKAWKDYLQCHPATVEVSYETVWSQSIHEWVVEHCQKNHYDMIVKTGVRSENWFYTPSDWQLFREAPAPVYSVNILERKTKKNVLVALDLDTHNEAKIALNRQLIEAAFRLSVQTDTCLHCCFAIHIPSVVKELDLVDVPARVHQTEEKAKREYQSLLDEYDVAPDCLHIKEGKPWNVINEYARKLKAQCVVVGSLGRSGIPGKLIGNTAEKVVHRSATDLLVLKPN